MPAPGFSLPEPALLNELCRRIATGRTLRDVCRDDDMPHFDTVYVKMQEKQGWSDAIARARHESAHGLADAVIEIAYSSDDPAKANLLRNRCDQHRWLAGKSDVRR